MNVPPSRKAAVYVATEYETIFTDCAPFFERLASASGVFVEKEQTIEGAVQVATQSARIFLPMDDLIDKDKERERLNREKAKCEKEIEIHTKKLANENFVSQGAGKGRKRHPREVSQVTGIARKDRVEPCGAWMMD